MPQLEVLSFVSQLVWFSFFFWTFYVVTFFYFIVPFSFISKLEEYLQVLSYKPSNFDKKDIDLVSSKTIDTELVSILSTSVNTVSENSTSNNDIYKSVIVDGINSNSDLLKTKTDFVSERTLFSLKVAKHLLNNDTAVSKSDISDANIAALIKWLEQDNKKSR